MDTGLRGRRWCPIAYVALAAFAVLCASAAQARRVALVIGNDSYQSAAPLRNARADATAMSRALEAAGFRVTLRQDLTLKDMKDALRAFKAEISGGDEAVFVYSGHGIQIDGINYLVPIDLVPQNEDQVADDSVPLQRVLDDLRDQKARFALAIIDACRDNPFKSTGRAIGHRGLAPVTAADGQMIVYSAGAGQQALDQLSSGDPNPNGVFTRVFVKEMAKPGVPVDQVVKSVRAQVVELARSVNHEQVPALYDQSLGDFYFVPGAGGRGQDAGDSVARVAVQTPKELEQEYWDRIKGSADPNDYADYQRAFPNGAHSSEAALLVRKLERSGPAAAAPPASQPAVAATRALSMLINPVNFNNRPVAQAPSLMFETLKSIGGLDPTLASPTSPRTDFSIAGTVLSAPVSAQANPCAQQTKQVQLQCLLHPGPAMPYIATVPVQIDFRVTRVFDGKTTPYLFNRAYQLGVHNQQEAQNQAIVAALRDGTMAALQSAGLVDGTTDSRTRTAAFKVNTSMQREVLAADLPIARSTGPGGGGSEVDGAWRGSYTCGRLKIGLRLNLKADAPRNPAETVEVKGTFEFFPLPESAQIVPGSYELAGSYTQGRLIVNGSHWVDQPRGYVMVGLNGLLVGTNLTGTASGAGCSTFEVRR